MEQSTEQPSTFVGEYPAATMDDAPGTASTLVNLDENPVVIPLVISLTVFVQFLLPFVFWCCSLCTRLYKECKDRPKYRTGTHEIEEECEGQLQVAASARNQDEFDEAVQEYRQTVQEYRRRTAKKDLNRERGFCSNATSVRRLISLHMYLSFYCWLIYLVGCETTHCTTYGLVFYILQIFGLVMLGVAAVIVFIESFFSRELKYLKNVMEDGTALGYIRRMREVPPKINITIECYHYETRERTVQYTDSNGHRQTRKETYVTKVVSLVGHEEFRFNSWMDVSKNDMPILSNVALARVKIYPRILFGDQETEDDYKRQVKRYLQVYKIYDQYTSHKASKAEIPGLKKRISAYVDSEVKPFWMRRRFYWIATVLQLSWPYRWLFRARTAKKQYVLKKKMYISATPPREVELTLMDQIEDLVNSRSFAPSSTGPDNTTTAYPMSEMNTVTGNPADVQNGDPVLQSSPMPNPTIHPSADPEPNVPPPSYQEVMNGLTTREFLV